MHPYIIHIYVHIYTLTITPFNNFKLKETQFACVTAFVRD